MKTIETKEVVTWCGIVGSWALLSSLLNIHHCTSSLRWEVVALGWILKQHRNFDVISWPAYVLASSAILQSSYNISCSDAWSIRKHIHLISRVTGSESHHCVTTITNQTLSDGAWHICFFYKATIADVLSQDDLMCVAVQHMQILPRHFVVLHVNLILMILINGCGN